MQPISGQSAFVFPSDRHLHKHINPSTANVALKRMGFGGQLVAHGLRSLASTTLNEQGFDGDTFETALAHVGENQVRNAYNRSEYINQRTLMMRWLSDHIERAATGNMSLTSTKSLSLVRAIN